MEQMKKVITTQLSKSFNFDERGNLIVRGYFTSDRTDEIGDIITKSATIAATEKYKRWGNIRYMHGNRPVGKVLKIGEKDGLKWNEVEFKVVPPDVKLDVQEGVLSALSVGIFFRMEDFDELDTGGWQINNYVLAEISLVDHPANYDAVLMNSLTSEDRNLIRQKGVTVMLEDENTGTYTVLAEGTAVTVTDVDSTSGSTSSDVVITTLPEEEKVLEETQDESVVQVSEEPLEETKAVEITVEKSPACRQADESKDDCVSRKIPEIMNENPDMEQDQAIAIAESMCEKSCDDKGIDKNQQEDACQEDCPEGDEDCVEDCVEGKEIPVVENVTTEQTLENNETKTIEVTEPSENPLEEAVKALNAQVNVLTEVIKNLTARLDTKEVERQQGSSQEEQPINKEMESETVADLKETVEELSTPVNRIANAIETAEIPSNVVVEKTKVAEAPRTLAEALKLRFKVKE